MTVEGEKRTRLGERDQRRDRGREEIRVERRSGLECAIRAWCVIYDQSDTDIGIDDSGAAPVNRNLGEESLQCT